MEIHVFTIFPEMVESFAGMSLLGKAQEKGLLDVRVHDPRAHTTDVHRSVDDSPFGGGAGMALQPEPLVAAVEAVAPRTGPGPHDRRPSGPRRRPGRPQRRGAGALGAGAGLGLS